MFKFLKKMFGDNKSPMTESKISVEAGCEDERGDDTHTFEEVIMFFDRVGDRGYFKVNDTLFKLYNTMTIRFNGDREFLVHCRGVNNPISILEELSFKPNAQGYVISRLEIMPFYYSNLDTIYKLEGVASSLIYQLSIAEKLGLSKSDIRVYEHKGFPVIPVKEYLNKEWVDMGLHGPVVAYLSSHTSSSFLPSGRSVSLEEYVNKHFTAFKELREKDFYETLKVDVQESIIKIVERALEKSDEYIG